MPKAIALSPSTRSKLIQSSNWFRSIWIQISKTNMQWKKYLNFRCFREINIRPICQPSTADSNIATPEILNTTHSSEQLYKRKKKKKIIQFNLFGECLKRYIVILCHFHGFLPSFIPIIRTFVSRLQPIIAITIHFRQLTGYSNIINHQRDRICVILPKAIAKHSCWIIERKRIHRIHMHKL